MKRRAVALFLALTILVVPASAIFAANDYVIDEVVIEPKDPILATVVAFGPGLLVHGWGQFYSENYKMGLLFTGIEILSIGAMTFGYIQNTNPEMLRIYGGNLDEVRRGGALVFAFGIAMFLGTWLADIVLAGPAAEQYNKEHNLEFRLQQESYAPSLMYSYKF
ncbi:MAG: hypothetical protein CVV21_02510 [Candidatus Goldiibacteriota bacterium HGW-Goldbacteria-1]|jgi:hypothetical protein|nr:MAG: hypothetical protein CVV21_02510 [Candidatus Goldiibacteriota bacterium HGW-Goldbacteria-1]